MKKRLLALALCLVLAVSLLPITAAAKDDNVSIDVARSWVQGITHGGTYCTATTFTLKVPSNYDYTRIAPCFTLPDWSGSLPPENKIDDYTFRYTLPAGLGRTIFQFTAASDSIYACTYDIVVYVRNGHDWGKWISNGDGTHSRSCQYKDTCGGYEKETCVDSNRADCKCDDCGASMHNWQFKADGDTLTGTCNHDYCPTKKISVTLKADSVTLPNSPFNARLEGWEQFKEAFPTVSYEKLVYKYKGSDGWSVVEPTAANAKAGEYQVGVRITNLPGPVVPDGPGGPVAMAENQDGVSYADLYVKYTAADPAITAQTGDNRPVELMMAGVAVFSALAAAAFVVDNKRRNQR